MVRSAAGLIEPIAKKWRVTWVFSFTGLPGLPDPAIGLPAGLPFPMIMD